MSREAECEQTEKADFIDQVADSVLPYVYVIHPLHIVVIG